MRLIKEALAFGRSEHNKVQGDGPNSGHQCTGCHRFMYAQHELDRIVSENERYREALTWILEKPATVATSIHEFREVARDALINPKYTVGEGVDVRGGTFGNMSTGDITVGIERGRH